MSDPRRRLTRIAAAGLAAGALAATAGAASSPPTAVRLRMGSHPTFFQVVVDLSGARLNAGQLEAADPNPRDGTARVDVLRPGARTTANPLSFQGVTARVARTAQGLQVRTTFAAGKFDLLGYSLLSTPPRLAVVLWRTTPPLLDPIRRGTGGCLTLDALHAGATSATASGHEKVFEHQFTLRVKNANGRVLATRTVTGSGGRWQGALTYTRPSTRYGTLEAFDASAKDGALDCLVHVAVRFP